MVTSDIDLRRLQTDLKKLREARHPGKSVRLFAHEAGISPSNVALMEGNKKKELKKATESSPTVFMLHRYLKACKMSLTDFFSEFEAKKPEHLSVSQVELLDGIRVLITSSEEIEALVKDRIEDVKARIVLRNVRAAPRKPRKKKAG